MKIRVATYCWNMKGLCWRYIHNIQPFVNSKQSVLIGTHIEHKILTNWIYTSLTLGNLDFDKNGKKLMYHYNKLTVLMWTRISSTSVVVYQRLFLTFPFENMFEFTYALYRLLLNSIFISLQYYYRFPLVLQCAVLFLAQCNSWINSNGSYSITHVISQND